jgi:arylsulfatase A-like enzyme
LLRYVSLSLVVLTAGFVGCRLPGSGPAGTNILLISIDTLRPDHLGCYGYYRNTSPAIDSLAAAGVRWEHCQAQSPWTLPSHATMWTGLSAAAHKTSWYDDAMHMVDPSLPTIATVLHDEGYRNIAFTNVWYLNGNYGFDREFDHFDWHRNGNGRAGITMEKVARYMEDNIGNPDPFFMVVHLYDVHAPYAPPQPYDTLFTSEGVGPDSVVYWEVTPEGILLNRDDLDRLVGLYDGEIRWVDDQLSFLFSEMRRLDLADKTVVFLTSDHGEEFLEHGGWGHGHTLYQELLHVPMIVSGPGVPAGTVDSTLVGLYDIFPTVTGMLGYDTPESVEGSNMLDSLSLNDRAVPAGAVSPNRYTLDKKGLQTLEPRDMAAVVIQTRKVIWDVLADSMYMYRLARDPLEMQPLEPDSELTEAVMYYKATPPQCRPDPVLGDENKRALEDLGYI